MPGKGKGKACDVVGVAGALLLSQDLGMRKIWSGSEFLGVAYHESNRN